MLEITLKNSQLEMVNGFAMIYYFKNVGMVIWLFI